uniref:FAD-binding FR-type domain-containing protein n=1 Tax=Bionectria ochroleuca TaxID=29856 RepID=A0A8H7K382_BIOOC
MRSWWLSSTAYCLATLFFVYSALAAAPVVGGKVCGKACRQTFRTLRFSDAPDGVFFAVQECTSRFYQQSVHLCWEIYCSEDVWILESRSINQTCQEIDGSQFPTHDIIAGFTDEDVVQIARFNATSPDRVYPFDQLMLPSRAFYDLWGRTLDAHDYIWDNHYYYGWAMGIFWAVVVAVGVLNRALMQWEACRPRAFRTQRRTDVWFKRNILAPATFGRRCVQDFGGWGTLPPRVQTLTLTLFVLINIVCAVNGYRFFEGYGYYPTIGMQILRHVSDRTGIISFANFPLIWLFGMRNNVVIWLTGWDFKTYNNFHRWVGRLAALQAVIHSVGYTALILQRGGWDYFWRMCNMTYWWTGELATIFMCSLVGLSVYWLRRRQYEVFLLLHIILSILVLITMLGHVSIFKGDYDALVWIPVMIWVLDRVVRGARILAFSPQFWNAKARIAYNEDAHMIRMVVPVSSSLYSIKPGTFYYLMVLNKWNFWESHPFTVASVSRDARCDAGSLNEHSPLLNYSSTASEEMRCWSGKSEQEMTFLIRPYDSFTLRLKEYADAQRPKPATVRVAIDGPYGKPLHLERFCKVLFIVGGSGIAVPLSYLDRLTRSPSRPKLVHIHWAVRQCALAVDVLSHELNSSFNSRQVKINIYVTSVDSRRTEDEDICCLAEWNFKRLNAEEVIEGALNTGEEGSLAVITSGPARMADESRYAVAARMVHSSLHIEYFEESFQW